ncbi:MAG: glutamine--fructose-6-phosphate transaminase (isomerizing) [Endomicrobiia bacterium]
MCGIIGYVGEKNLTKVLINGLKKLEYRGYDSSGIAILSEGKFFRHRAVGKIIEMEKTLPKTFSNYSITKEKLKIGLAHTRWATHGKPSEENAHPHTDCKQQFVLVHNGIIENYLELKSKLKDHKFSSETDTEIIVHLIEENYKKTKDVLKAIEQTLKEIKGSYAIVLISVFEPTKLYFARKDSPLVLGIGENEKFIASDIPAMLSYTNKFIFLENYDYGFVTNKEIFIYNLKTDKLQTRKEHKINWDPVMIEKAGYKHFMLKEIYEQPLVIKENLVSRVFGETISFEDEIKFSDEKLKQIKKIVIIACGTSYHAALVGKYFIEKNVKIPVDVDIASEFRYREPLLEKDTLAIFISQSGETADTLASLSLVKEFKIPTLGICNVIGSSLYRETDSKIYTRCGPEIGVASTKAFTGQLVCIFLFGLYIAKIRKTIDNKEYNELLSSLYKIPAFIEQILNDTGQIKKLAKKYFQKRDFLFLGRGINYPIALEGALKLKEISYIHAEGYPAGEMKHGPIALIDKDMPVVVIATKGSLMDKIFSNLEEAKSRSAKIIALINDGTMTKHIDEKIILPEVNEQFSPLVNVIPLQLLAYYIAVILNRDVDQPRNLAKSVTVE